MGSGSLSLRIIYKNNSLSKDRLRNDLNNFDVIFTPFHLQRICHHLNSKFKIHGKIK